MASSNRPRPLTDRQLEDLVARLNATLGSQISIWNALEALCVLVGITIAQRPKEDHADLCLEVGQMIVAGIASVTLDDCDS